MDIWPPPLRCLSCTPPIFGPPRKSSSSAYQRNQPGYLAAKTAKTSVEWELRKRALVSVGRVLFTSVELALIGPAVSEHSVYRLLQFFSLETSLNGHFLWCRARYTRPRKGRRVRKIASGAGNGLRASECCPTFNAVLMVNEDAALVRTYVRLQAQLLWDVQYYFKWFAVLRFGW